MPFSRLFAAHPSEICPNFYTCFMENDGILITENNDNPRFKHTFLKLHITLNSQAVFVVYVHAAMRSPHHIQVAWGFKNVLWCFSQRDETRSLLVHLWENFLSIWAQCWCLQPNEMKSLRCIWCYTTIHDHLCKWAWKSDVHFGFVIEFAINPSNKGRAQRVLVA